MLDRPRFSFLLSFLFLSCTPLRRVVTNHLPRTLSRHLTRTLYAIPCHAISGNKDEAVVQQGRPWVTRQVRPALIGSTAIKPRPHTSPRLHHCIGLQTAFRSTTSALLTCVCSMVQELPTSSLERIRLASIPPRSRAAREITAWEHARSHGAPQRYR